MTRDEFLNYIQNVYKEALEIIKRKNQDYAKDSNPFSNFDLSRLVGIDPKRAILVRLSDKLSRISNLIDKPPAVVEESCRDTALDAINYLAIFLAYLQSEK